MNKEYSCCGQSIEVLRGEAINNRNTGMLLYAAMCRCNQSLLYVVREMSPGKAREDHVNDQCTASLDCLEGDIVAAKQCSFVDFYVIFGIISTQREKGLQLWHLDYRGIPN